MWLIVINPGMLSERRKGFQKHFCRSAAWLSSTAQPPHCRLGARSQPEAGGCMQESESSGIASQPGGQD